MFDSTEVVDTVSDSHVTTTGCFDEIPGLSEWIDDVRRNEEAQDDADHAAMIEAAEADGLDATIFDIPPRRYAELVAMIPANTGWIVGVDYHPGAEKPYTAALDRGTPNGPDRIRLGSFYRAENAMEASILFLINMTLIDKGHGDDATRTAIAGQIEYAKR